MRVQVTLENILAYGLDTVTGNTREDLLARAAEAEDNGYEFFVKIPDVVGGDTEAPIDRNAFAHYSDLPAPDGRMHEQYSVDLSTVCSYRVEVGIDGRSYWLCKLHNALSKHAVDADSHAPCLAVDPYPQED